MTMRFVTLLLPLLLIALPAQALQKSFAWDSPTTNVDGSPAVVDGYRFYRSTDGGATFTPLGADLAPQTTTATDATVPAGSICYQVTAFNLHGESAASTRLCFHVPPAEPQAPSQLREMVK